jgi:NADH-quinone oxidoreductase subunit L
MPTAFWCFLIGSMSLAAFPFLDSGFYSKELILGEVFASGWHGQELWLIGCLGAFITALYTGRMMMLVFFGESHAHLHIQPGRYMRLPLVILAALATIGGAPELLRTKEGESLLHT